MFRTLAVILLFTIVCFSQQGKTDNQSTQGEADAVIVKARNAIGLDKKGEVRSFHIKTRKTYPLKELSNLEDYLEVTIVNPDRIQAIYSGKIQLSSQMPSTSQTTRTWNGAKYKSINETEFAGKRTVKDTTKDEAPVLSKTVSDVIGKGTSSAIQNARNADQKVILADSLWTSLFPLILSQPLEKSVKFGYAGRAKSNETTANVIDLKPANGRNYRLLFDSETNYLLMMIVSYRETNDRFTGSIETKYYFSDRQTVDGLLVPKKIKVEEKITPDGKPPVVKYSNIEIIDFGLNPKVDEKIFEIK